MAEPGGARQRRPEGRRALADQAQPGARARGDRRELPAALLRQERHDRLLRPARLGRDRGRRAAASRPHRAGSSASARSTSRPGRCRRWPRRSTRSFGSPPGRTRSATCGQRSRATRTTTFARADWPRSTGSKRLATRVAAAPPESLRDALAALDETFVDLTERDADPQPRHGLRRPHALLSGLHARPRRHDVVVVRPGDGAGASDPLRGRALVFRPGQRDRPARDRRGAPGGRPGAVRTCARGGRTDADAASAGAGRCSLRAPRPAGDAPGRSRSGDHRRACGRGVRRPRARLAPRRLPIGRPADRRGERGGRRRRRLPRRRRRRPRRPQPALPGRLRASPSRPGRLPGPVLGGHRPRDADPPAAVGPGDVRRVARHARLPR